MFKPIVKILVLWLSLTISLQACHKYEPLQSSEGFKLICKIKNIDSGNYFSYSAISASVNSQSDWVNKQLDKEMSEGAYRTNYSLGDALRAYASRILRDIVTDNPSEVVRADFKKLNPECRGNIQFLIEYNKGYCDLMFTSNGRIQNDKFPNYKYGLNGSWCTMSYTAPSQTDPPNDSLTLFPIYGETAKIIFSLLDK